MALIQDEIEKRIEVEEILSPTELRGRVLNSKKLGERKNCNLPGVKVDIPVLTPKDVDDLQNFACKHQMDFVAASFVQNRALRFEMSVRAYTEVQLVKRPAIGLSAELGSIMVNPTMPPRLTRL